MANKKIKVELDLESNKIINLGKPIQDQDAATKKYVDDNASGGGGGGAVVEFRTWNIPFINNKAESTEILDLGLFPQGYYLANVNFRAVGESVSASLTELESIFFGNASRVSLHPNEQVLNPRVYGVDNTGNRDFTILFRVQGVSGSNVFLHTNYIDDTKNILIGGGKVDIFRLQDPVASWS